MDPRFQPQQYPSHNPYQVPESQPGPNKYPTLPPVQNTQQNQPNPYNTQPQQPNPYNPQSHPSHPQSYPQNNQYPPQNPQNNHYNPAGGPPGYIPPAQYGNHQAGPIVNHPANEEKFRLMGRIRDLERELEGCGVKCYKFWSWVTIIFGALSALNSLVEMPVYSSKYGRGWGSVMFTLFLYNLWSLIQSGFAAMSIAKKDLGKANVACIMMSIYLIPSVIAEMLLVYVTANYRPPRDYAQEIFERAILYFLLFFVTVNILFHTLINLVNAFKVKRILTEMKDVEMKMIESESSFNANSHQNV